LASAQHLNDPKKTRRIALLMAAALLLPPCRLASLGSASVRRRGFPKGAHLLVAPLWTASFGTFLAGARKVRRGTIRQIPIYRTVYSNEPGEPNGVTIIAAPKARHCLSALADKFQFTALVYRS